MATQTIERLEELAGAGEITQVIPAQDSSEIGYQGFLTHTEVAVTKPVPVRQDGLLVRVGRLVVAFDHWLFGPPMSARDRLKFAVHVEKARWYWHM